VSVIIKTFKIVNKLGLHARPAAKMVEIAKKYEANIYFERDGREVNGRSLLGLLTLACPMGSRITVRAEGADAEQAVESLGELIAGKFGEE
jgi:phosphocarrier protein HPr